MKINQSTGALAGVKILDLSRVLAGPWASQLLADLGADVVKIERPGTGDDTRAWGPPWLESEDGESTGESAYFLSANRNKRPLTVDLTTADGQALVGQLAHKADVLIENFKVGTAKRFGLDYSSLAATNKRLVYCSITGFGQTGPYALRPGYDFLIQGMGGLMGITGRADDCPGGGPMKVGVALVDILTGLYAAVAIQAALAHRDSSGEGQYIDMALLDVQVACLANQAANYLASGVVPRRMGNAHPNIVPYQDFPTADGHLIITVGNDRQFAGLCGVLNHPEWAADERFTTNSQRVSHRDELIQLINSMTIGRTTDEWINIMTKAGVPCGPINGLDRVFADPQVKAREMQVDMPHPLAGHTPLVANPIRMSASPVAYARPPPTIGEHNEEVLKTWLGLDEPEILDLTKRSII